MTPFDFQAERLYLDGYKLADKVVTEHRYAIESVARALNDKERLSVQEIRPIVMAAMG